MISYILTLFSVDFGVTCRIEGAGLTFPSGARLSFSLSICRIESSLNIAKLL